MDKIVQAITEIELETSDIDRCHIDPDLKEQIANRIAKFLVKGVGNPNPVYDLFVQAHNDGKFPLDSPKGRGDFLRDYANRCIAMFTTKEADFRPLTKGKMLSIAAPEAAPSYKGLSEQFTEPVPPKAIEKADA
jgi:hypothetical protein